ncbi:unnamed protein product [Medioppia subpectinata]|uniref:Uncharacterized protein n=1 Tax=Medioppia subpectinata TaxID=1979941 RepID=A0A7R9PSS3_9ACAR|nr:unnamed protein product [Medioppia subpectinata]CAG2099940.1 unnamed protein product [Medioppia subpectinata]
MQDRCMLIGESIRNIPLHKKNLDLGTKEIFLSNLVLISQEDAQILEVNEEFTLMNWGNAIVKEKIEEKGIVKTMKFLLNLNGDYKTTKNKITWISKKGSSFVKFYEYGNLQNESASEDLVEKFNKESKKEEWWIAEGAISKTKVNDFVQIERIGFFRCDKSMEFNLIPFTKQKRKI